MADFSRARSAPRTAVLLSVLGGLLLVVTAFVGTAALAAAVVVLQLATAASWHDLVRAPGARAGSLVGLACGVAATSALAVGGAGGPAGDLAVVAVAGLFAAFVQQLLSSLDGPTRLQALTATTALVLVEVLAAGWLPAAASPAGEWVVVAGVGGALVVVLAISAAGSSAWVVVAAVAASAVFGALVTAVGSAALSSQTGAGVAAAAGLAAVCGAQVRRLAGRSARTAPATVAALPLVLAGPATFIAARILQA